MNENGGLPNAVDCAGCQLFSRIGPPCARGKDMRVRQRGCELPDGKSREGETVVWVTAYGERVRVKLTRRLPLNDSRYWARPLTRGVMPDGTPGYWRPSDMVTLDLESDTVTRLRRTQVGIWFRRVLRRTK